MYITKPSVVPQMVIGLLYLHV